MKDKSAWLLRPLPRGCGIERLGLIVSQTRFALRRGASLTRKRPRYAIIFEMGSREVLWLREAENASTAG